MTDYPRRFRIWPPENDDGDGLEGVVFSCGTIALRAFGRINGVVVFHGRTVDELVGEGGVFLVPARLEWLDGAHRA